MSQPTREGLVRGIRRWDLVAIVINAIIGAGIFGLPSIVYKQIEIYSLFAFLVCALVVILIVLCFAEVGSRFDATGGPYLYAREAFGPLIGFEVGWLQWLTRITGFAATANLLIEYLPWPGPVSGAWRVIIITSITVTLTIINIAGVRSSTIFGNLFTIGKLIPLIFFVATGLFFINSGNYSFAARPSFTVFSFSILQLVYAFTGFEMAVIPSGEIQNPQRNIPIALLTAIGVVVTLYILIQLVSIGTLPELASSKKPLADASRNILGAAGASIISAGAMISIIGNLNVTILAGSRLPYAMAERQQLPRFLSSTHRRFHTPHFAILLSAALMLTVALSGTFIYALTISAIARLLTYAATCAALISFRFKSNAPPAKFKAPAGIAVSIIALLLIGWLLSTSGWNAARDAGIAAALGLLIYLAFKLSRRGEQSFE